MKKIIALIIGLVAIFALSGCKEKTIEGNASHEHTCDIPESTTISEIEATKPADLAVTIPESKPDETTEEMDAIEATDATETTDATDPTILHQEEEKETTSSGDFPEFSWNNKTPDDEL